MWCSDASSREYALVSRWGWARRRLRALQPACLPRVAEVTSLTLVERQIPARILSLDGWRVIVTGAWKKRGVFIFLKLVLHCWGFVGHVHNSRWGWTISSAWVTTCLMFGRQKEAARRIGLSTVYAGNSWHGSYMATLLLTDRLGGQMPTCYPLKCIHAQFASHWSGCGTGWRGGKNTWQGSIRWEKRVPQLSGPLA